MVIPEVSGSNFGFYGKTRWGLPSAWAAANAPPDFVNAPGVWKENLMEIPLGVCHPAKHQGQCPPQWIYTRRRIEWMADICPN